MSKAVYAGFWRRVLAFVLDYFLLSVLLMPVMFLVYGHQYFFWLAQAPGVFASYGTADTLLTKLLPVFLIIMCWLKLGATPGKLMLDCKIVDAKTLEPIGLKKALVRLGGYVVSALPFYLGFVWIAIDKRKQGLHDKLAGTVVLYQPNEYAELTLEQIMERLR